MKIATYVVLAVVVLGGLYYAFSHKVVNTEPTGQTTLSSDVKNLTFTISGNPVTFKNGVSTAPSAPGAASMVTTTYFGNEVTADLNGDGLPDLAFLITQNTGGSGTFFYLVGAIKQASGGYKGTQAMLIGDRIAPQTTAFSNGLVVVNYADRAPGEPMTAQPSVGKSLWLKYDPVAMDFGEVVQNFEGESAN